MNPVSLVACALFLPFPAESALEAEHLSWEPQCGTFIVINENLANLIPSVACVVGAGGVATDMEGNDLMNRCLGDGRTSVVYAANAVLHAAAMRVIKKVRQESKSELSARILPDTLF